MAKKRMIRTIVLYLLTTYMLSIADYIGLNDNMYLMLCELSMEAHLDEKLLHA